MTKIVAPDGAIGPPVSCRHAAKMAAVQVYFWSRMMDTNHNPRKRRWTRYMVLPIIVVVILLIVFAILGSSNLSSPGNSTYSHLPVYSTVVGENVVVTSEAALEQSTSALPKRVIIREGYISLVVEDTKASKETVAEIVNEMEAEGAYVVTSNERGAVDGQMPTIYVTIRVPSNRFDEVMEQLTAMSVRVSQRREEAQDVTEEYVDLQARLESMEAARERLREIMQEAETVEDLLRAEQQLTMREAEIEAIQGRLRYLAQSAQLSKIEISLHPSASSQPIVSRWQPGETARNAVEWLVKSGQGATDVAIYFGIAALPWLIVFGIVAYGAYRIVKRYRGRQSQNKETESGIS